MKTFLLLYSIFFLALFVILFCGYTVNAQDSPEIDYASNYLESRTSALHKYLSRSRCIQQKLLRRLKRQEARMMKKLAAKDTFIYNRYLELSITYDSIASLAHDNTAVIKKTDRRIATIDSLKSIQIFIQKLADKLNSAANLSGNNLSGVDYTSTISEIQAKLNAEGQVNELINQRIEAVGKLTVGKNISGLQSLQKKAYYAQEKMKAWRELADDPDEAEEKAMEYLQGVEGFDSYLNTSNGAFGGLSASATAADLQNMGYQTKGQLKQMLQEKFGGNLQAVQQSMGQQLQQFSEKLNVVTDKVKEAKATLNETKQMVAEAKTTKDKLKHFEVPTFAKNGERSKPFWQRLEIQYNFQTTRSSPDALRPAMLEVGTTLAFKHTPKLSYGIGLAASLGLGRNWQNIKLTYEGISTRAYTDWILLYGFSVQTGYERIFRPFNRPYLEEQIDPNNPPRQQSNNILKEAFGGQQQVAYAGIMKRYRINSKWCGTFVAGYNFLWHQSNLRTPFMIRFGWEK